MQNLREAIAGYRGRLMHEGNDVKRNALLQVAPQQLPYSAHSMLPAHAACTLVRLHGVCTVSCARPRLVVQVGSSIHAVGVC